MKEYDPIARKAYYESVKHTPEFKIKAKEQGRRYRRNNKDKILKKNREWVSQNRDKVRSKKREDYHRRKKEDPLFHLHETIRGLIRTSFKRSKIKHVKSSRTEQILGCSIEEFLKFILDKCPEGVTIDDFGQFGYHLDHIIPIDSATSKEDILKLNHYSNFQPLWWTDNLSKSSKIL